MSDLPASIGQASMSEDGTIRLFLRAEGPGGILGDVLYKYEKTDPRYQEVLKHIGGISVGEKKPVPPWP
jgi:hypothetical protein